jgi:hypothetical protein
MNTNDAYLGTVLSVLVLLLLCALLLTVAGLLCVELSCVCFCYLVCTVLLCV